MNWKNGELNDRCRKRTRSGEVEGGFYVRERVQIDRLISVKEKATGE